MTARREALDARIVRSVIIDQTTDCWHWKYRTDRDGYGRIAFGGGVKEEAHRVSYEVFVGPIPVGMQLDHVCHTRDPRCPGGRACLHRRCVNFAHLAPVTLLRNVELGHERRRAIREQVAS